ncbi:hypothetical protein F4778DRAFT_726427 [Xylariomycetidae sp. FL2044]|nr:hypothetical protein F4778DRAFT_726427 [Xylariomycetidae sp. FL2044]
MSTMQPHQQNGTRVPPSKANKKAKRGKPEDRVLKLRGQTIAHTNHHVKGPATAQTNGRAKGPTNGQAHSQPTARTNKRINGQKKKRLTGKRDEHQKVEDVNNAWETRKLKPQINLQSIAYHSRLSPLVTNYIPTIEAVKEIAPRSVFVAFDTETVPGCYKVIDVGFAILPRLNMVDQPTMVGEPNLEKFVDVCQVQTASFKINGRYAATRDLKAFLEDKHGRHMLGRERLRFGSEQFVDIEDLESVLTGQIEAFRQMAGGRDLVLVGMSLEVDLERMCLEFPAIIDHFAGWIDLSMLFKASSPSPVTIDTGIGVGLRICGFPQHDTGFGKMHHAGNDAVRTLAVLQAIQQSSNMEEIVVRQTDIGGVRLECDGEVLQSYPFKAVVHNNGSNLPRAVDSAKRLAISMLPYSPVAVAADWKNDARHRCGGSVFTRGRTRGCICFGNKASLDRFVAETKLKVERCPLPSEILQEKKHSQEAMKIRRQRKASRKQTKRRGLEEIDLSLLFAEPEEDEIEDTSQDGNNKVPEMRRTWVHGVAGRLVPLWRTVFGPDTLVDEEEEQPGLNDPSKWILGRRGGDIY